MLYNIFFHPYETDVAEQLRGYTLLYIIKRAVLVDDVEGQRDRYLWPVERVKAPVPPDPASWPSYNTFL